MSHFFSILACGLLAGVPLVLADETTTITPGTTWGTWEGWGTSLAWWAKAFGDQTEFADIFFTLDNVTYSTTGVTLPGLGLNIVRYNAGACSSNADADGDYMVESPDIEASRQMDAFWTDWQSTDPSSEYWSWSVDANQRNMLKLALQNAGSDGIAELFSNSPVWWMLYNLNPSGSNDGSSDNLESWNWDYHAIYLANVAQYAKENWGVTFASVDAFNEPSASYWVGTSGTQEGCHFNVSTMQSVIIYLRTELNSRGLTSTIVSASDEEEVDIAITTFNGLNSTALGDVGRINVHGYEGTSGNRAELYSLVSSAKKKLWTSEYGDSDATGESMVECLFLDLTTLHPTAWVYWQVLDVSGWGMIIADNDAVTTGAVEQKYYVLAQFTRHIRPGMVIMDAGSDYAIAAYDSSTKTLTIVAVNWGDAQYINFDLSKFTTPGTNGALVQRWETTIGSSGSKYQAYDDTYISGTKFWSYFDTDTIMSFTVEDVVI
ncbi:glycoside hydrolase [Xylariaceae sp. FL0255]|nr:glycoside hydrolase [Xylariaceae sp. FL0255]